VLSTMLPIGLACAGTALTALAVFAPRPLAPPIVSFAPPAAPPLEPWNGAPPLEPWSAAPAPWPAPDAWTTSRDLTEPWAESLDAQPSGHADESRMSASWPAEIDARATRCDAAGRLALVEALAGVRASWATDLLRRALAEEPDERVQDAIRAALTRA
jgi:hypothetical protein